jgi:polysaccharide export outer membrane protein
MRFSLVSVISIAVSKVLVICGPAVAAPYAIGPSDEIDIAIVGVPQLQRRVQVQLDGTISFPHLGTLTVMGLSLDDLRKAIRGRLGGQVISVGNSAESTTTIAINQTDVLISIASVRPVYVRGAVMKPGAFPFQGTVSIREAIALAGGVLGSGLEGERSMLEAIQLRSDREAAWRSFVREKARLWSVKADLSDRPGPWNEIARDLPPDAEISRTEINRIVELAVAQMQTRRQSYTGERDALSNMIAHLDREIAAAESQIANDEKALKEEEEEFARLTKLRNERVVNSQRYAEARRDLVASSTRMLFATSRLNEARRQRSDRELQLHKLSAERVARLYAEQEEAATALHDLGVKLRTTSAKLLTMSREVASIAPGARPPARYAVIRRNAGGVERLDAEEDFLLAPGDVVDVDMGVQKQEGYSQ